MYLAEQLGEGLPCVDAYVERRLQTWSGMEGRDTQTLLALIPYINPVSYQGAWLL